MSSNIIIHSRSGADKSLNYNGLKIKKGKEKSRIQFITNESSAVAVAAKLLPKVPSFIDRFYLNFSAKFTHIKLKHDGGTYLLNVGSLSSRLHLSKNDITQAVFQNNLFPLMEQRSLIIPEINETYARLNKKQSSNPEKDFHDEELMQFLHHISKELSENQFKACKTTFNKKDYIVGYDPKRKRNYLIFRFQEKLSGTIEKVQLLNSKKTFAFKHILVESSTKTNQEKFHLIQTEYDVLKFFNRNGPCLGLQEEPILGVYDKICSQLIGYIGTLYQKDYSQYCKTNNILNLETFCEEAFYIISGVKKLHEYSFHNDIKSSNILVKKNRELHLADMEGVDLKTRKMIRFTRRIMLLGDHNDYLKAKAEEKFKIGCQIDVFQTGLLLVKRLIKSNPFKIFQNESGKDSDSLDITFVKTNKKSYNFISPQRTYNYEEEQSYYPRFIPLEIQLLLEGMISIDRAERPTITEVHEALSQLMSKHEKLYELYNRFQEKLASQFPSSK